MRSNSQKATTKSEETGLRILEAALELFRTQGFDEATMRGIAQKAEVATGAAYYYYPSKEAIVMDFYRRSWTEIEAKCAAALEETRGLEARLRALIEVKLAHFGPNRGVFKVLVRAGTDPQNALSPFSRETKEIRDADIAQFRTAIEGSGVKIPRDIAEALPGALWFFQTGVILYWVTDPSAGQKLTGRLADIAVKAVATLIRLSSLPLMKPLRRTALELIGLVAEVAS